MSSKLADARSVAHYDSSSGKRRAGKKPTSAVVMANSGVLVLTKYQAQRFYECMANPKEPTAEFRASYNKLQEILKKSRYRNPALKARILTELQKGKATSDQIAKRLDVPQQEVGAKLSRLYADGHIERALTAVSPHTGRPVLQYWLRKE